MTKDTLLAGLAGRIIAVAHTRTVVAVDGVDGAGKSHLADHLALHMENNGWEIIRASIDDFHNEREVRYRQGKTSPQGFFQDSYNYPALRQELLEPFKSGASSIAVTFFDHRTNARTSTPRRQITTPRAILILDGIFLHRPELRDMWDVSLYLTVPFSVTYARMAHRDGSNPDPQAPENKRYLKGQEIYLSTCSPQDHATFVIDNSNFQRPALTEDRL
ncbi:uridine kinase [Rhizobium sp. SL86]|uniref:uridine kinase n=1 Tax=Rhizobium sp. SL86 TaxID=2995148 RepID=UPI002272BDF2|nr:uridine kinase [Rhizobium sp. SL86]MCY1666027.1 uridine kinase [Rhizobium sp. SL86]